MMQNLGAMLSELHALLQARGCKVTELSITLSPFEDDSDWESEPLQVCVALPRNVPAGNGQR